MATTAATTAVATTTMGDKPNFVKVLHGLDVQPLLKQLADHPELWNTNAIRTGKPYTVHYDVDDIIMRYPRPNINQYNYPAPTHAIREARIPIVFGLMKVVGGEYLGRVLISRLPPGKTIPPHDDYFSNRAPLFFLAVSRYRLQGKRV